MRKCSLKKNNPSINSENNSIVSDADVSAVDTSANDVNNSDLSDNALDGLS